MASLFNIGQEFKALYNLADEIEVDENGEIIDNSDLLLELFNELSNDKLESKLENVMYIIKEIEVSQKALKDEAKRLTDKAKVFENRANRLKEMIKDVMIVSGQSKIKTDKFNFGIKTLEEYNYDDVNMFALDSEFIRRKEEIDKTKLKAFIKAGGVIDGVRISEKVSLAVR